MSEKIVRFEKSLQKSVKRFDETDMPRAGDVVFRFSGEKPFRVTLQTGRKTSIRRTLAKERPRLEIGGDPERIQAILDGEKDPRLAFLEGSITVRGDIDYLRSVLVSLGLMD